MNDKLVTFLPLKPTNKFHTTARTDDNIIEASHGHITYVRRQRIRPTLSARLEHGRNSGAPTARPRDTSRDLPYCIYVTTCHRWDVPLNTARLVLPGTRAPCLVHNAVRHLSKESFYHARRTCQGFSIFSDAHVFQHDRRVGAGGLHMHNCRMSDFVLTSSHSL